MPQEVTTKRQIFKAAKIVPKLIPKLKPELKTAYKDVKRLVCSAIKAKNDPEKVKMLGKKFRLVLIKHHKRLSNAIEEEELPLGRKIVVAIAGLLMTAVIEIASLAITYALIKNKKFVWYINVVFVAPIVEESLRLFLEHKYHAGLVYTSLQTMHEFVAQTQMVLRATDPKLYSELKSSGQIEVNEKIARRLKSIRWKSILLNIVCKGMLFTNHFIQRHLLKRAKEEDKPRLKTIAFVITAFIHIIWNALGTSYGFRTHKELRRFRGQVYGED